MSNKDRCSTCGFYNITLGLCKLPNCPEPGIARSGSYHCANWIPYKKECNKDCKGNCDDCDDCSCGDKPNKDNSNDDLCNGHCGSCNASVKDSYDMDPADNYWPFYGDLSADVDDD